MSLIERCAGIDCLNRERRAQELQSIRLGAVQDHWALVKSELDLLHNELSALGLLATKGVLAHGLPRTVAVAQDHCRNLRKQVAEDTELNLKGKSFKEVENAIRQARSDVRSYLYSEWRTFVDRRAPPMRAAEVAADRNHIDPVRKQAANEVFDALTTYERVAAALPTSATDFRAYERASAVVGPALADYRSASDLPPAVEAFFKKANSGQGARLSDLTAEVAEWLEDNGRQHLFRIRATHG
jgi:hypothetical protein